MIASLKGPSPPNVAAPNVSREHRPFFRFRFPFSAVSGPACQQFRTLFRSSFRLQPKIPYLIPGFIFLYFSWVLRTAGFSVFSVFSAFSGFQGSISGILVFPFFPFFPPFPAFGVQIRNSGFSVFSVSWGSKPGIPGSRLRPRLVRPRLARTERASLVGAWWRRVQFRSLLPRVSTAHQETPAMQYSCLRLMILVPSQDPPNPENLKVTQKVTKK